MLLGVVTADEGSGDSLLGRVEAPSPADGVIPGNMSRNAGGGSGAIEII